MYCLSPDGDGASGPRTNQCPSKQLQELLRIALSTAETSANLLLWKIPQTRINIMPYTYIPNTLGPAPCYHPQLVGLDPRAMPTLSPSHPPYMSLRLPICPAFIWAPGFVYLAGYNQLLCCSLCLWFFRSWNGGREGNSMLKSWIYWQATSSDFFWPAT